MPYKNKSNIHLALHTNLFFGDGELERRFNEVKEIFDGEICSLDSKDDLYEEVKWQKNNTILYEREIIL